MTTPAARPTSHRSRRLYFLLILAGLLFLAGVALFAARFSRSRTTAAAGPMAQGRVIYETSCAGCHGREGKGLGVPNAPPLNSRGEIWKLPPGELRAAVFGGTHEGMPAFGQRLSEAQVDAVLAYIQSWWSPEQLSSHQAGGQPDPPPTATP